MWNGGTGSGASGAGVEGWRSSIGAAPPSWSTNAPGQSAHFGGTASFCSNDDQIHCGRLAVFCAMCRPTRPTVTRAHPPPVARLTIAVRV